MDTIDFQNLSNSSDDSMESLIGRDIFGLLDSQNEAIEQEEQEVEEHFIHFKYSEKKKQKLMDAFKTSYVNDYGKNDPYHMDMENSFVAKVKNQIHAIYGNRSIVQYIEAMRDVFKVYQEMYQHSSSRLVMDLPEYISQIVSGDIPAPFNHPLIRTNVPSEIIMRYILNEKLDPNDIKRYVSNGQDDDVGGRFVFDFTNVDRDFNTPVEYEVLPEKIQVNVLKSWLSGKLKRKGLNDNESNLVYILTSIYDKADLEDASTFKFDEPISHHRDILSWKNIKRQSPKMIRLKDYTEKSLQEKHRGEFIRAVMDDELDEASKPGITFRRLFERMETTASAKNQSITTMKMLNKLNLYAQGVVSVKLNKYGREVYKYRDKSSVKANSIKANIRDLQRKADVFKELTDAFYERLHSDNFQAVLQEIHKEQDIINKFGISYYTEGE